MKDIYYALLIAIGLPTFTYLCSLFLGIKKIPPEKIKTSREIIRLYIKPSTDDNKKEMLILFIATVMTTILTLIIFPISYFIARKFSGDNVILESLFFSIIIFLFFARGFRERIRGRFAIGGMENPFLIASGTFLVSFGSYIIGSDLKVYSDLITFIIITVGSIFMFIGFKKGPVYGWV